MRIIPIKTHKITREDKDLFGIFDKYLPQLSEKSIVAITSKIISITEGRIVQIQNSEFIIHNSGKDQKDELIEQESEFYLPRDENKFNVSLTVTRGNLVASAGIDESNGNGYYILWPADTQAAANKIREYLGQKFNIRDIGVIITDGKTTPLRWGVTGFALSYSGFVPLKNYIGADDIFGRKMEYTKMNIADGLAGAATLVMGEGNEQTPLAVISDLSTIEFQDRNPTQEELAALKISMDEDLYAPFLKSVKWQKGKR